MRDLIIPFTLLFTLLITSIHAATFEVLNQCIYSVWAAARPGGGQRLDRGQSWTFNVDPGTTQGRIWGRTGCKFDADGNGNCTTGDCAGRLQCQVNGIPPNTIAEYALNQYNNMDFYAISLVEGFNIPMDFSPTSVGCRGIRCAADIIGQCPSQLRAPDGCNNPCTVFMTEEYCCNSGSCQATGWLSFFKQRCPDAYINYPNDPATFSCPVGTNYRVVFCP